MNDVVDRVLSIYGLMGKLDAAQLAESRERISAYIETLASTGRKDAKKLAIYGLAYLRDFHEGAILVLPDASLVVPLRDFSPTESTAVQARRYCDDLKRGVLCR